MATQRGEYELRRLQTKTVFKYVDPVLRFEVVSRESYGNGRKEIHYPFRPRDGQPKYRSITKIVYEDMPRPLPKGFLKAPRTGYGFTRDLSPVLYRLQEEFPHLAEIVVSGTRASGIQSKRTLVLANNDLQGMLPRLKALHDKQRSESGVTVTNELAKVFPKRFTPKLASYGPGQLGTYIDSHAIGPGRLSTEDVTAVADLLRKLPSDHPVVMSGKLLTTKATVDRLLVEDLIEDFESLLSLKSDAGQLESKWQDFLSDRILYFNFGYIEKFEKQLIQGDKAMNIPDFVLLNTLGFLDLFEIKTHLTPLVTYDTGRKNFYWTSQAAKAISQAENYVDSLVREEDRVIKNIRDEYGVSVDAVRPHAYIIASSRRSLAGANTEKYKGKTAKKLWNDYRRLNHSLVHARFVLYDELLDLLKNLAERLSLETEEE